MLDPDLIAYENINENRHIGIDNQNYAPRRDPANVPNINNETQNHHGDGNNICNDNKTNRPDVSLKELLNEDLPDSESTLSQDEIMTDDRADQAKTLKNPLNNNEVRPDLAIPSTSRGIRSDYRTLSQPPLHGAKLHDELYIGLSLTQAGSRPARGINEEFFTSTPLP
ncbi:hypothetical protein TKK_0013913 [Trichogramma kaykai]|uniref:Uncharacterized protein n=1 Tax=Trichogramma kaykai TaxID=54128 RepID=A0ABD2WFW0_9HYME